MLLLISNAITSLSDPFTEIITKHREIPLFLSPPYISPPPLSLFLLSLSLVLSSFVLSFSFFHTQEARYMNIDLFNKDYWDPAFAKQKHTYLSHSVRK